MAELGEVVGELLEGTLRAVARSESRHLRAHVEALTLLAGQEPGTAELVKVLETGWTPDFFVGSQMSVSAQLAMTTTRERKVSGGGGVTLGPLRIEGSLAETFQQGTQTNLAVTVDLVRQSRSRAVTAAVEALRVG